MSTTLITPDIARRLRQPASFPVQTIARPRLNSRYRRLLNLQGIAGPAATSVTQTDTICSNIVITAMARNQGYMYVGGPTLTAVVALGLSNSNGFELAPGAAVIISCEDVNPDEVEVMSLKDIWWISPVFLGFASVTYLQWGV